METEQGAAAPVDEQAVIAPAESEQATQTQEQPNQEAAPENAETKETEQSDEQPDEPKRLTRNQRLQRKAARLSTMVAEQAAEIERFRQTTARSTADAEPKPSDYESGEYDPKYIRDHAAHIAKTAAREALSEREERDTKRQLNERTQEAVEDFLERVESVKKSIPDYDQAVTAFANQGGKFEPHVIEEIRDSEKGPQLAYHLAKNPGLAAELNAMSARDAAREIGRLEAKVSLPQPKRQTQAPAPLTALNGGASPARSVADLAKSEDVSELIASWRKK